MRSLLPLQVAVLIALCVWFWSKYLAEETAPDWRQGELFVLLPPEDSLDRSFNQSLAELFAAHLNVRLRPMPRFPERAAVEFAQRRAHISAIGNRLDDDPATLKSPSYQTVREQVVCSGEQPRQIDDLLGRNIVVVAGSAQEAALREARLLQPALRWTTYKRKTARELLKDVGSDETDCTVANEEQIATMRNYHPDMTASLDIAAPSRLGWLLPPDSDPELVKQMQEFFEKILEDGTLQRLLEQYYGYNERLKPADAEAFLIDARTLLHHYRPLFDEAATLNGLDWKLLAAMAYRESRWNPLATSPTNVRGIMMLTEVTADQLGVSNRLDPKESIFGGARYLRQLRDQLPLRIEDPDRTWFALAAYNQGRGHLEDARILAQSSGLDPDSWVDVKKVMPQLRDPDIGEMLKHGSARGGEAVIYVETIRLYYEMLQRLQLDEPLLGPPSIYSLIAAKIKMR